MFEKHRETPNFGMKFVKFWSIKTLFGNKIKLNKMKALRFIPIIALMVFASCSANRNVAKDDTYYSPYNNSERLATGNGSYVSPSISSSSEYDYQAYYSDSKNYVSNAEPVYQTTETVTDTNGVVYTTTETYYDADFAARIKRFGTQASSSRDYYDDYYTGGNTYIYVNSYDPFYWDYYPTFYYGWSYRPYWSSYWSWNWYWGYPYYYSYWGWDPYWAYGWGYHDYYWHHRITIGTGTMMEDIMVEDIIMVDTTTA